MVLNIDLSEKGEEKAHKIVQVALNGQTNSRRPLLMFIITNTGKKHF